ncbi:hypothetical protein [Streptomyces sudanensis]|uniref:hypothetical protein n=1 Tax=Streptomyces TaxID=1883 RepID=UPI00029AEDE5
MTGVAAATGGSLRLVRTVMEVAVLAIGWLLGGTVGVGTVLYALAVGPVTQLCLPRFTRTGPADRAGARPGAPAALDRAGYAPATGR